MIIYKCDKCGLTEEHEYFAPKLINNIGNKDDYHKFWYFMVSGSVSYIDNFPISQMFIPELDANLCNLCFEKWSKFKTSAQDNIKKVLKQFMEE